MVTVQYGVKGAKRVSEETFKTQEEAQALIKRWTFSNNPLSDYWAKIK